MPSIHYLSEQDKIDAINNWENVTGKLSKQQLQMALVFLLNGIDIDEAFEFILASHK